MPQGKDDIIDDWNSVVEYKLSPSNFVNKYWERFMWLYISIFLHKDDGDLIIILNEVIDKMLKMDVLPIFTTDKQFSQYIKISFLNIHRVRKKKDILCQNNTSDVDEDIIKEIMVHPKGDDILKMDMLLCDLEGILTENQLQIVALLLKGHSRNDISKLLGIGLSAVNNRIYYIQEKVKNYMKL